MKRAYPESLPKLRGRLTILPELTDIVGELITCKVKSLSFFYIYGSRSVK